MDNLHVIWLAALVLLTWELRKFAPRQRTQARILGLVGVVLWFATLAGGCAPPIQPETAPSAAALRGDDPAEMALHRWEDAIGPVSAGCRDRVEATPLRWASDEELRQMCGVEGTIWGCTRAPDDVELADNATTTTAVHELMHVLEYCETGHFSDHTPTQLWADLRHN